MKQIIRWAGMSAWVLAGVAVTVLNAVAAEDNQEQIERVLKTSAIANGAYVGNSTPNRVQKPPFIPTDSKFATRDFRSYESPRIPQQVPAPPRIPSIVNSRSYESPRIPAEGPRRMYQLPRIPQIAEVPDAAESTNADTEELDGESNVESAVDVTVGDVDGEPSEDVQEAAPAQREAKKPSRKSWNWFSRGK